MHGHADGGRAHAVLADAVVDLAPARVLGASAGRRSPGSLTPVLPVRSAAPDTRPGKWSRTAPRTLAIAWRVAIFSPCSNVGRASSQPFVPVPCQAASHAARSSPSRASSASCQRALASRARARRRRLGTSSTRSSGAQNGSSGMPITALVAGDVLGRERVAVGGRVVGVVGRRRADVRPQHEQRRAATRRPGPRAARPRGRRSRRRSRRGTRRASRRPRSGWPTSSELDSSVGAVDRDPVVVEDADQPAEPEVAGERRRLVADALHEAAVAGDDVGVVVDEVAAEALAQHALGDRHADGVAEALAERTGRHLDAGRVAGLGVARRARLVTGGRPRCRRARGRSRRGRASSTGGSRRGRWRARSGRGRATPGRRDRA